MKYFFDTSALVKLFQAENGSEMVEEIVNDPDNDLWVLDLVRIEFLSSIYRRYRNKDISEKNLEVVIDSFNEQLIEFNQELLGTAVLYEAEQLMNEYAKEYGLRSLDALHLAACRILQSEDWYFVCADNRLCNIAKLCKINVLNPVEAGRKNSDA